MTAGVVLLALAAGAATAQDVVRWRLDGFVHEVRTPDLIHHPPAAGVVVDPAPAGPAHIFPTKRDCLVGARAMAMARAVLVFQVHSVAVTRTRINCVVDRLPANVG